MNHEILEVKNLSKTYSSKQVVKDVSLDVHAGEIVGLLGPNGAGKTTSFYMIVGLVKGKEGQSILEKQILLSFRLIKELRQGLATCLKNRQFLENLMLKKIF